MSCSIQAECKSAKNSRDLYFKQFNETKETLTNLQRQIMVEQKAVIDTKSNISKKEQEIQELKANMEEENRKALQEKEVLINKLEQLNIELKDREVIKEMQEEK